MREKEASARVKKYKIKEVGGEKAERWKIGR